MTEKPKPFSMIRSFTGADVFTLANASCGTISIFLCLNYIAQDNPHLLWIAFFLLPAALAFDVLDGYVARKNKRKSFLGADLDSLADVISFGVAPAVLGFTLGMRGGWDLIILTVFVMCGVSRLARFNATMTDLEDAQTGKVKYFEGTPIPTSILLVALLGIAFRYDHVGDHLWFGLKIVGPWQWHPLTLVYLLSGSLMISTIRVPKP